MSSVITVTLNPAIDLTVIVPGLTVGEVHRAQSAERNAGGKGVNVAGCLADWDVPVTATGILGKDNQVAFESFFAEKGIIDHFVRVPGETRTNIKLADTERHETTDVNLPGVTADEGVLAKVKVVLSGELKPGTLVVVAGSLPRGLGNDVPAELCVWLKAHGAKVMLDTSGAPLKAALALDAGNLPDVIKPNQQELEEWAGTRFANRSELVEAAQKLQAKGIELVVVSMGSEGALFVTKDQALFGHLPPQQVVSTVGAGDAMVAGLAAGLTQNASLEDIARLSLAFAAAKLGRIGPNLPDKETVRAFAKAATLTKADALGGCE